MKLLKKLYTLFPLLLAPIHSSLISGGSNNACSNSDPSISVSSFKVQVNDDNVQIDLNAEVKKTITGGFANLEFGVMGSSLFTIPVPICDLSSTGCPIQPGTLQANKVVNYPSGVSGVTGVLSKVPGLGLEVKLTFSDENKLSVGCTETSIGNPINTQHPAVSYASYVLTGTSVALSLMGGLANLGLQSSHVRPGCTPALVDVALVLQTFAMNGMLGVKYPEVYTGWTTNFAWTLGAINVPKIANTLANFRPAQYQTQQTSPTPNALIGELHRRNGITDFKWGDLANKPDTDLGVTKYAKLIRVKPQDYFLTVVIIFLILFACITALCLLLRLILELLSMYKPKLFTVLRDHFALYYLGNLLRVFLLGYCVIVMAALYQLTLNDYWVVTLIAGVTLGVFCFGLMGFVTFKILRAGPTKLFSEPKYKYSIGPLYTDYRASIYAFFIPNLLYLIIRAVAVSLLGNYPWVQLILLVANEIVYFILVLVARPYALRIANGLNVFITILKIVNLALLFLFIQSIALPSIATNIIGIVLIVLNVLQIAALLIVMIWSLFHTCKKLIKGDAKSDQVPINRNSTNLSNRGPKSSMSDSDFYNTGSARSPNSLVPSTYPNDNNAADSDQLTYQPTGQNLRNSQYIKEESSWLDRREDPYYRPKLPWVNRSNVRSSSPLQSDVESYADNYRMERTNNNGSNRDSNYSSNNGLNPTHL